MSSASLGALAFLVVFGSLLAFTAYGWLVQHAPTPLLSTYAYVNPAVAVFLGWAFAGEHVGGREVAAGLVILASVGMLLLAREEPEEAPAIAGVDAGVHRPPGSPGRRAPPGAAALGAPARRGVASCSGVTLS